VHDHLGGNRYPSRVEAAGYFCCAALVDEVDTGERLDIELSGDSAQLCFLARGTTPMSPAVHQLMLDRVEALGGRLAVSREGREVAVRGEIPTEGVSVSTLVDGLPDLVAVADLDVGSRR
jgi:hypothetical protein